jgi:catechol 2,3-dioxygenase-like lactoylglutathione lyase family enzyme
VKTRWPPDLPVVQIRVARPTSRLREVVQFYHDGLGLPIIDSFEDHEGYSGVMLGLPGHDYHLEFTRHTAQTPCPAPSKENLLVLYMPDRDAIDRLVSRLAALGRTAVSSENPYWETRGLSFEDPDGWRVVLMNTEGIGRDAPAAEAIRQRGIVVLGCMILLVAFVVLIVIGIIAVHG